MPSNIRVTLTHAATIPCTLLLALNCWRMELPRAAHNAEPRPALIVQVIFA